MDQGVAAVWAGFAGLGGACIGGAAAVWGSWVTGKKSVEAAEKQAHRAALAEHQAWQRQARYEAYRLALSITEEMAGWTPPTSLRTAMELLGRLREAVNAVYVLGPPEATAAARRLLEPMLDAMFVHVAAVNSGVSVSTESPIAWDDARAAEMFRTHAEFREVLRAVLERPPS
jgi:hypothetical protein